MLHRKLHFMRIAAQLYTLRDFTTTAEGFRDALRRCAAIGYAGVQLSAVSCMSGPEPTVDASTAKEWLDEFGLLCCATHRGWERFQNHLEEEVDFHRTLACNYAAVPGIGQEFGVNASAYTRFLEAAEPVAARLLKSDIQFGFHNHAHEFARNPDTGRPCIELLIEPEHSWLEMEVDTYWVAEAGVCPADFLRQCQARIYAIHVKDREIVPGEGPRMAAVGEGNLNWESILEACRTGKTEWLIVEQDICPRDPYSCLESSFNFLAQLV